MTLFKGLLLQDLVHELLAPETLYALSLSLRFSVLALALSWMLSLVFLFFKNRFTFSLFRFLWVLPGFAYALITLAALRFLGVEQRYSMTSVLIAWVLAGTPYLTLAIRTGIQDLDLRQKEVLQSMGAGPLRAFYHFEFLRTLPAQSFALLQQFWLYLTSFSLVMILSGGFPNETLEVAIYTSVRMDRINLTHAWALGLWQVILLVPCRIFINRFRAKSQASEWIHQPVQKSGKMIKALRIGMLGLVVMAIFAFTHRLDIDGLFSSLGTSLILAALVSVLTLVTVLALYYMRLGIVAEIGAWISPMLLTLLWWKCFAFSVMPMVNALLVQIILFAPWMARSLFPLLKRVRVSELEAARSLGCTPARAWMTVEWPRIRGGVFFTLSLVLALSLTEVTAVLLFAQNEFEPLSVWVQNAFMRFRMDEAILGTCLLIAVSYAGLSLGRRDA